MSPFAVQSEITGLAGLTRRLGRDCAEDADAFCALSNALYARKVTPAYYRWQFFETPFPSRLAMAFTERGELAGCYGIQARDSSLGARTAAMALDIMVAPRFQRQGLFRALSADAIAATAEFQPRICYVLANAKAHAAHVDGLGWAPVAELNDLVAPTAGMAEAASQQGIATRELTEFAEADRQWLRRFNDRRRASPGFSLSRDPEFLSWRVFGNPRYSYQTLCCQRSGKTLGYLILKRFRDPTTGAAFGDVIDVLTDADEEAWSAMLKVALGSFESQGIASATGWFDRQGPQSELAARMDFREAQRPRFLSCWMDRGGQSELTSAGDWRLAMLDTDIY